LSSGFEVLVNGLLRFSGPPISTELEGLAGIAGPNEFVVFIDLLSVDVEVMLAFEDVLAKGLLALTADFCNSLVVVGADIARVLEGPVKELPDRSAGIAGFPRELLLVTGAREVTPGFDGPVKEFLDVSIEVALALLGGLVCGSLDLFTDIVVGSVNA